MEPDRRSALVRSGDLRFKADGSVDARSAAVRDGRVLLTESGDIDRRSSAVRGGDIFDRPSTEEGASTRHTRPWTEEEKDASWNKTSVIPGCNPDLYGVDRAGNTLYRPSYGKTSTFGWEVDHSKPLSEGGTNHLNNLQALQHATNRHKGRAYPYGYDTTHGVTAEPLEVDLRSSTTRTGTLYFLPDGTVDRRSAAVHSGDVLVTDDGRVDRRSAAVRRGDLRFKG